MIVLMNLEDMQEAGLEEASTVTLVADCDTHQRREVGGLPPLTYRAAALPAIFPN
ncbi:hypothetical protein LH128_08881 [Sphingomonas sp. LH128]|uniref:hypothetical protein n=2 Tax=Sphingomonadaceae TaxID=41297 RepID=UPI00027CA6F5|nr:hypothetical protein [Novosphingobium resinovorum]EJU13423.1 hypothetical protein LH128_08881 [Sphingomonas sp. LH128]